MSDRSILAGAGWLSPERLRRITLAWIAAATIAAIFHILSETRVGLTNGKGIALGEDFINYWTGAVLAAGGRAHEVYDFAAFHQAQLAVVQGPLQLYHYSYPPVMLMLSRPLAFVPYVGALLLWSLAGLAAFAFALSRFCTPRTALLYALAIPATFINLMEGQNGLWTGAILGLGLAWLPRRPLVSGALFGVLLTSKPQLALLVPLAFLADRNWRALGATACASLLLISAAVALYGWDLWIIYQERVGILRHWILENGNTWIYMPSIFVLVRHLPASTNTAYAAQALVTVAMAIVTVWAWWRRDLSPMVKNAILVSCLLLATPYIQYYDLLAAAMVPIWLLTEVPEGDPRRAVVFFAAAASLIAPIVTPLLASNTGFGLGWLLLLPGLYASLQTALSNQSRAPATNPDPLSLL